MNHNPASFHRVAIQAIPRWLGSGWRRFNDNLAISLAFATFFLACGLGSIILLDQAGLALLIYPLTGGFLLIAPALWPFFVHVSDRLSEGQRPAFSDLITGFRSAPAGVWLLNAILTLLWLVWLADAVVIYAIYFGTEPVFLSDLLQARVQTEHLLPFLGYTSLMGGAMAIAVYLISLFSVPLMVHHRQSFAPAIIAGIKALAGNFLVMLAWGLTLALCLVIAILIPPLFLVLLPVLGFASNQAYRDIMV